MKTDELIQSLVADLPAPTQSVRTMAMRTLPVSIAISLLLFVAVLGLRPGLLSILSLIIPKLLVMGALACAATIVAMRLTRPESPPASLYLVLGTPLAILAALMAADLTANHTLGWQSRAIGKNGIYCLTMIPLLSALPLAATLYAARCGAVIRHYSAGAAAGLAAAGIGGSLYALHCTDDSPLFVALWYMPAALIMALAGALACKAFVKW